jgi:hypothetical protein
VTLDEFVEAQRDEGDTSASADDALVELRITEPVSPRLPPTLAKLRRLGLLNGDAIMSIVAQAPLDPLNLAGVIMDRQPAGWTFSAVDCSMVRVLSRSAQNTVSAAIRIDLLDDTVDTLVANQARQLTIYKHYEPEGAKILDDIQAMCDEAVQAATREELL